MRHLVGVLLAIVMAAVLFFAASWGYLKLVAGPARAGSLPVGGSLVHDHVVLEGFGVLLAVGLLAGILIAVPRISPLASGLPGLALLGWTGLYLFSVRRAVRYIPLKTHPYGSGFEALLFAGMLAMLGIAMIVPLFVPSRWRSRPVAAAPYEAAEATHPDLQDTQTMAGGLLSGWSQTTPQPQVEPGQAQAPWDPADPAGAAGATGTGGFGDTADYS